MGNDDAMGGDMETSIGRAFGAWRIHDMERLLAGLIMVNEGSRQTF